jgi:phage shock protein A
MSRHEFADNAGVTWTVGWDEPMVSYFAQRDVEIDGERELEDLAGTSIGEVTTYDGLLERLRDHVELPEDVSAALRREAPQFTDAKITRARAQHDQLGAMLRDAVADRSPEVER